MSAKSTKSTKPKKPAKSYVDLFELVTTFTGRKQRLIHHVEAKDRTRLLNYLADSLEKHRFYELGGHTGHEALINTRHVTKLNVLEYLGDIQFEAEPEPDDEESMRRFEERENDETPVILRIWLHGEAEPEIHHEVHHAAWGCIRHNLTEKAKFIEFEDEDGEPVLYGVDHLDAIEAIDPFHLTEEQVEKRLARDDPEADDSPKKPQGTAAF